MTVRECRIGGMPLHHGGLLTPVRATAAAAQVRRTMNIRVPAIAGAIPRGRPMWIIPFAAVLRAVTALLTIVEAQLKAHAAIPTTTALVHTVTSVHTATAVALPLPTLPEVAHARVAAVTP